LRAGFGAVGKIDFKSQLSVHFQAPRMQQRGDFFCKNLLSGKICEPLTKT